MPRGKVAKPTVQKMHDGETRPSRLNFDEPMPKGDPWRPDDMVPAAEKVWDRIIKDAPIGLLTSLDTEILRLYCEAVARYVEAQKIYHAAPLVRRGWYVSTNDTPGSANFGKDERVPIYVKNPAHQVMRDNAEQVRLLARELGFSPSARANLHIQIAGGPGVTPLDADLGEPARLRLLRTGTDA
jgi:P27 family predicted phage terminase small subunit